MEDAPGTVERAFAIPKPCCCVCGTLGVGRYWEKKDARYSAPGMWHFYGCPECETLWLNPSPTESTVSTFYQSYYTHPQHSRPSSLSRLAQALSIAYRRNSGAGGAHWRRGLASSLRLLHPGGAAELERDTLFLKSPRRPARVLDVGCGDGTVMLALQELGWQVEGVEPDPVASARARARHLAVRTGGLADAHYAEDEWAAITARHVIEHMPNPATFLAECYRVLEPGGALAIVTPNITSLGHRFFQQDWFALDTPRHLILFSPSSLRRLVEESGFVVVGLRTNCQGARGIWCQSSEIRRTGRVNDSSTSALSLLQGLVFQYIERVALLGRQHLGEEILLHAVKPAR